MKAVNRVMLSLLPKYLFLCMVLVFVLCPREAFTEPTDEERGVTHNGVVFNIAKDRKIERIGGLYEPEGIDKYFERKMDEVKVRIAGLEEKLNESNKKLDDILIKLELQKTVSESKDEVKA